MIMITDHNHIPIPEKTTALLALSTMLERAKITKHPTVYKAAEQFRVEQKNTEIVIAQLNSGDFYEKTKKSRDYNEVLKTAVLKYSEMELMEYLDSINCILH